MSRGRKERLARLIALVQSRKAISLAEAALQLGVSYKHMKYFVAKEIMAMSECVDIANDTIVWVCGGEEG